MLTYHTTGLCKLLPHKVVLMILKLIKKVNDFCKRFFSDNVLTVYYNNIG